MLSLVLILVFLFCFAGIIVTAYFSIEAIKAVAIKFSLSKTFIGAVFLSIGTSFPEFINSLASGIQDSQLYSPKYSVYSFYNVTGANIWQIVFLVVAIGLISGFHIYKKNNEDIPKIVDIFWRDSFLSWKLVFCDTLLLLCIFLFPSVFDNFNIFGFSAVNLIFLLIWIFYLSNTYHTSTENLEKEVKYFSKLSKHNLLIITFLLWIFFGSFAYGNFYIASKFPISNSSAFGVILSFVTSTPEFSALYFLFRQKEYAIAVGGFFGSSLFNLTLPFYTNLLSLNPIFGVVKDSTLSKWLLFNLFLLVLFLLTFVRNKKLTKWMMMLNGILVFSIYIAVNLRI